MTFELKTFDELDTSLLYDILALRASVFIVEQNCPYLDTDYTDQYSWHVIGYEDDAIKAYARLIPKEKCYDYASAIGRVVVSKDVRNTGAGKALMDFSIQQLLHLEGGPVKISAQTYAVPFYKRLGFSTVGEEYLEDDIPHIAMILE